MTGRGNAIDRADRSMIETASNGALRQHRDDLEAKRLSEWSEYDQAYYHAIKAELAKRDGGVR